MLFFLVSVSTKLFGQFYTTGDDPGRVKWSILKGEHYNVIYPYKTDSLAKRYYNLLESYRPAVMNSLHVNPKKISVILHPYTSSNNGLVVWAPKRMELFTIPPADNAYAQNWEEQLSIHESRHVGQMTYYTRGIFKILSWIIGEQATGVGAGVYPSKWMMEGDAVISETELTNSGRGRSADFMKYYRVSFLNGEYRSFNKWAFGSNIKYAPDIYGLGYLINSSIRLKTNNYSCYNDIADYTVRHFYNPAVRCAAFKKYTGGRVPINFNEAQSSMTNYWREDFEARGEKSNPNFLIPPKRYFFVNYRSMVGNDNSMFLVEESYDKPASLLKIENNSVKPMHSFSSNSNLKMQYSNGNIYWTEPVKNVRWGLESYNELFSYNVVTDKISRLSKKRYYYNPSINDNGDTIAVSNYISSGGSLLMLLDANGKELDSFKVPANGQILESTWTKNGIVCTVITDNGLGVYLFNKNDKTWTEIVKPHNKQINTLRFVEYDKRSLIYFCAEFDGVNNIYAIDLDTRKLIRLTNSRYGAGSPLIVGRKLYYTETELNGNFPAVIDIHDIDTNCGDVFLAQGRIMNDYNYDIADSLSAQARRNFSENSIPFPYNDKNVSRNDYSIEKYNKLSHLFRIHSWAPVYYNVDRLYKSSYDDLYEVVDPGAVVYSQNTLGTAVTMLGYSYRKGKSPVKNAFHAGHFSFNYSGLYPIFELRADINNDDRYRVFLNESKEGKYNVDSVRFLKSPLVDMEALVYIPLSFSRNGWNRAVVPQLSWKFKNNLFFDPSHDKFVATHTLNAALQVYSMRPIAKAAIFPRFGAGAVLKTTLPTSGKLLFSPVAGIRTYFYLPGIASTHGIKLGLQYEKQFVGGKVYFSDNLFDVPRGYNDIVTNTMFKASFDYACAVNFNGLDCGWVAYFKQLQLIPFADYGKYTRGSLKGDLLSVGTDIMLNGYFFRIGLPVGVGFRVAHLKYDKVFDNSSGYFSLLFSATL